MSDVLQAIKGNYSYYYYDILFFSLGVVLKIVNLPDLWTCPLYNMFDT